MILVNCAWRQADIIKVIEDVQIEGKFIFKLNKIEGIRMFFDSDIDIIKGTQEAKNAIKKIPGYQALFFDVVPVVNGSVFEGYKYTACK